MRIGRNFKRATSPPVVTSLKGVTPAVPLDKAPFIALAGNPNSGKTTLFNALTGGRQKTGNYAGVTVERKEGTFHTAAGRKIQTIDLPGLYSLSADSPEERIAKEVLTGTRNDTRKPDVAILVLDASNLERNLYLAIQIKETGVPVIIALNMIDIARDHDLQINTTEMSRQIGAPVIAISAKTGEGIEELRHLIDSLDNLDTSRRPWTMDGESERIIADVAVMLKKSGAAENNNADWIARRSLFGEGLNVFDIPEDVKDHIRTARIRITKSDDDLLDDEVINRYRYIRRVYAETVRRPHSARLSRSERVDGLFLHKIFGPIIFATIMLIMFQAIFTWSEVPMRWIEEGIATTSTFVDGALPDGLVKELITDGIIAGVGNVLVFLPQIVFLFFFIALLEDTGYMTRAAFLLDRIMGKVGLNGHAFIPLLSSFACAVPGIMSTRTIRSDKDRIVTILVAPLMTCAARLPVYTLLIGAFFPQTLLFGFISLRGVIMLSLYLSGITFALIAAWAIKRFLVKGERSALILEMPSYKIPQLRNVGLTVWNSSWAFVRKAGTIILIMTIVLWFLITHPRDEATEQQLLTDGMSESQMQMEMVRNSYMGQVGQFIEPVIEPLGYDWKIGVSVLSSFAAREVIVGTLAIIYASGSEEETEALRDAMIADTYSDSKRPVWTPLVAASVLVFFVFALMCMSTLAVIRKETGSWKWPTFAFGYLIFLAYGAALLVYQGGLLLGLS